VNNAPAYSRRDIRIFTLARVAEAQAENGTVAGRWSGALRELALRSGTHPAEEFANYPQLPESIVRFTRKCGPLMAEPTENGEFRFPLKEWANAQEGFRNLWQRLASPARFKVRFDSGLIRQSWGQAGGPQGFEAAIVFEAPNRWSLVPGPGDGLAYVNRKLGYRAGTIWRFLLLDLLSCDSARLRTCKRPDCPHPFFVARHLKQNYCSDLCAAWGQRQWKLKWWEKRGADWRRKRLSGKRR
jgi:hypothetical protein